MPAVTEGVPLEEDFFLTDSARLQRWFPWLRLLRAFRIAADYRCLLLGLLGVITWSVGEHLLWTPRFAPAMSSGATDAVPDDHLPWPGEVGFLPDAPATRGVVDLSRISREPLATLAEAFSNGGAILWPLGRVLSESSFLSEMPFRRTEYLRRWGLLLWGLLVAGLFGGSICRFAAVESSAPGEGAIIKSARFAAQRTLSCLCAPLIPAVVFALLWVLNSAIGLLARIPVAGGVLIGLFWIVSLLVSAVMALIAVGVGAGWPLMVAGISAEKSDAFDGFSRSYSYVFNRPWYALFLSFLAVLYGSALLYFFAGTLSLVIRFAFQSTATGAGAEFTAGVLKTIDAAEGTREFVAGSGAAAADEVLLSVLLCAVRAMPAAFIFSYFWTATTLIYVLLRRREDGTPVTAVALDGQGPRSASGVPLVGVPAAADRERQQKGE